MPFNVIVRYTETKEFLIISKVPCKYTVGQFQDHLLKLSILTSDISNFKITSSGKLLDPITPIENLKTDDSSDIFVFAEGVRPIDDYSIIFGEHGDELQSMNENQPCTTETQCNTCNKPEICSENNDQDLQIEPQNAQICRKIDPNFNPYEVENIMDTPTRLDIRQKYLINIIIFLTVLFDIFQGIKNSTGVGPFYWSVLICFQIF